MISPAAPSTTLSLTAVTGSGPGASENAPIPEGFAALLALGGGDGETGSEAQAPADAGLVDPLVHAASGKAGGKMLPLLLPPIQNDASLGPDDTSAISRVSVEASPDLANTTPDANGQTLVTDPVAPALPDLIAMPAPAVVVFARSVKAPAPGGEGKWASGIQPSHHTITVEAQPAADKSPVAAPAEPMPAAPVAARSAGASERVTMASMSSAAPPAHGSAIAPTMAQPGTVTLKSPTAILAASVQVAARVAISVKGAEKGVPAVPYRPADPVNADEPLLATIAAPVVRQSTAPTGPVSRSAEALPELPMPVQAAVAAEPAVGEATVATVPVQVPLVVTAEAQVSLQSAPPAALTAGNEPVLAPHDFAGLVERLVDARDAVAPLAVRTALHHAEFGRVAMAFSTDLGALSVQLANPDPAFAPAVAAAAQVSTGADQGAGQNPGQPRPESQAHGGTTQQQANSQHQAQPQGGERQPRSDPALHADGGSETAPRRGDGTRRRDDSGIYA